MSLEKVHAFLASQPTCVVARVNDEGGASAATVGFSHDDDLKFLIATNKSTRKYTDMVNNSKVAVVVGFEMPITVQFEGVAHLVTAAELGSRLEQHFEKLPAARNFVDDDGQSYFLIKPVWLRYVDMKNPSECFELKEFNNEG